MAGLVGITDCHVHINPVWEMLPKARAILGTRGPGTEVEAYDRSPTKFLEYLDRCGIDRAVLINYVAPEIVGYTERANDFVLEYARIDPQRLVAVGGVLPTHRAPGAEVERLVRGGLRGLKLHPPHQRFSPNDYLGALPALAEIYETAQRLHLPVVVHTGTSIFPGARNRFGQPLLVEDVAIDYPQLTLVLAHGGRPLWMKEAAFLARRFPNVYLEISSTPPHRLIEYFPELERLASKVLFGSDWPGPGVEDIGQNLAAFQALPISAEAKARILTENPEKVFPRI